MDEPAHYMKANESYSHKMSRIIAMVTNIKNVINFDNQDSCRISCLFLVKHNHFFCKSKQTELIQYLLPVVSSGPSGKT